MEEGKYSLNLTTDDLRKNGFLYQILEVILLRLKLLDYNETIESTDKYEIGAKLKPMNMFVLIKQIFKP